MARAPIIISNGGVIGELIRGLDKCLTETAVEETFKDNLKRLKKGANVMILKRNGPDTPCLYWKLDGETKYEELPKDKFPSDGEGTELVSITDLLG